MMESSHTHHHRATAANGDNGQCDTLEDENSITLDLHQTNINNSGNNGNNGNSYIAHHRQQQQQQQQQLAQQSNQYNNHSNHSIHGSMNHVDSFKKERHRRVVYEHARVTKSQIASILAAITAVVIFTIFAYWMASEAPVILRSASLLRNTELSNAQSHTNCTDFAGAVRAVRKLAGHAGYIHQFEYERLHPCCAVKQVVKDGRLQRPMLDTSDIVFVVLTSSRTISKAKGVLESWGQGLEHLLFISDEANAEIGSIGLEEEMHGSTTGATDSNKYRQMWALKYIYADKADNGLRSKPWFFLADDDTWVNIPALLDLAGRYHHACPVTVGYVWSQASNGQTLSSDYVSASAGLLMSQAAFLGLTPAFLTERCPSGQWSDMTFGRCAWSQKVQIVHHLGFYYDKPDRSSELHDSVWLPPLAESITYHDVQSHEMSLMTTYANGRWQYTPKAARNNTAAYFDTNAKFASLAPLVLQ